MDEKTGEFGLPLVEEPPGCGGAKTRVISPAMLLQTGRVDA